ncbi:MAG TPA: YihY/virulence factor BrkB family protein [Ilumatobacter sp.]|nr:YihY/virulence factor BrkB family protein [Ilumatobacter sp.]
MLLHRLDPRNWALVRRFDRDDESRPDAVHPEGFDPDDVVDVTAGIVADEEADAGTFVPGRGREAEHPFQIPAAGWRDIVVRVRHEWSNDHVSITAAGVAFYAFLALFPAIAALVSILGLVTRGRSPEEVVADLFGALPDSARDLLTEQLVAISSSSSGALSIGVFVSLLVSLWSASAAIGQLLSAINVAYDEDESRNWFVKRGLAIVVTFGAILFVAAAVFSVVALPVIIDRAGFEFGTRRILRILIWPGLAIGFGVALAVLYRIAPDRSSPRWRWVSVGSVFAVVAWVVVTLGFRLYVSNFGSYNETYGSIAAVIVLMLWLWLTAVIVLLGAEINAETEHQTAHDTTVGAGAPLGERGAVKADSLGELRH